MLSRIKVGSCSRGKYNSWKHLKGPIYFYRRWVRLFPDRRQEGEGGQNDAKADPDEAETSILSSASPALSDADDGDADGEKPAVEERDDEALDDEEAEGQEEDQLFAAGLGHWDELDHRYLQVDEL